MADYEIRIGWLGMDYFDRISMRWLDVAVLHWQLLVFLFLLQARMVVGGVAARLVRVAMLLSLALAACLAVAVILKRDGPPTPLHA